MKILGRILFAFTVAIFLPVFNNFADSKSSEKYFNTEAKEIFNDLDNEDRYRIFYGSTGYHRQEAFLSYHINGYNINFFEINKVFVNKKKDVLVEEYLYIMIDNPDKILTIDSPQRFYIRFVMENKKDNITYRIHQFKNLPFSTVVDNDDKALISTDMFKENKVVSFEIFDFDDDQPKDRKEIVLASSSLTINTDDLKMKNITYDHYNDLEILEENKILTRYKTPTKRYTPIYVGILIAYIVIVIVSTYFLFFFKKKPSKVVRKK